MKVLIERKELPGYPYQTTRDVIADFMLFLYDFYSYFLVEWDSLSDYLKVRLIKHYVNRLCDEYQEIPPSEKEWFILGLCKYYNCEEVD